MKQSGPACTEALSEAEEGGSGERAKGNAGGVRVEWRVRATGITGSLCVEKLLHSSMFYQNFFMMIYKEIIKFLGSRMLTSNGSPMFRF